MKSHQSKETRKKVMYFTCAFSLILFVAIVSATTNPRLPNLQSTIAAGSTLTIFNTNITNFTDLLDVPSSYAGQGGKAVAVNSGATALEFVDFPADNPFDQVLNTTSNVTFNNITATGSVEAECINEGFEISFNDNAAIPDNGYITFSGGVQMSDAFGYLVMENTTIEEFALGIGAMTGISCSTSPIATLEVIHSNGNREELANITIPNDPADAWSSTTTIADIELVAGDQLAIYYNDWTCFSAPSSTVYIVRGERRCP